MGMRPCSVPLEFSGACPRTSPSSIADQSADIMKTKSRRAPGSPQAAWAPEQQAARGAHAAAEQTIVTLKDGEPCLQSSPDVVPWDWDMESVAPPARCQECGSCAKAFREPDGRILCEACLLRGPTRI